ncbi:tryptophan halogenase family protein [Alteromonas oceanisediminis]|uniref:tryptophan halogenase family protein n=1 Tax=Alteromonas oceanisediminis TaxID=2836180 RepID=UPI001BDB32EF|nr:tryptophan halogenase family protein [Alteromonas oceanisediminis]MBT0586792.1 tryptophan 7-halogenase [Alteromonas oceanisediminis]
MKEQPSPVSLVIVGGGTAGWMSALMLQARLAQRCSITLIESDTIGTIGVGEGTTPFIRQFFHAINVNEADWMPHCDATYKCGIRFPDWSTVQGYQSYYHPFYSALDLPHGDQFFTQANQRRRGINVNAQPEHFFLAPYLSALGKAPIAPPALNTTLDYAYHFDAGKLGDYLRTLGIKRGITHLVGTVNSVETSDHVEISAVLSPEHGRLHADFFVDCSGFRGLLIEQTLQDPFVSFADNLLNNAAVAIQTPNDVSRRTETRSEALAHGWMWQIPLTSRQGNGYVYSQDFCMPQQAETTLRERLSLSDNTSCRHLNMRVGRRTEHLKRNCMAIGLSQGFIEPLEATALMLVQFSIDLLASGLEQHGADLRHQSMTKKQINQQINRLFDGVRDYIVAHYKTNSRTDTDYWRVNREDTPVSNRLEAILTAWRSKQPIEPILAEHSAELAYLRPSWYCLLAGTGYASEPLLQGEGNDGTAAAQAHYHALAQQFPDAR